MSTTHCDKCGQPWLPLKRDLSPEMIHAHGWRPHPKEGSRFSMYDECLICSGWLSLLCADP